jgi:hypothetical protein
MHLATAKKLVGPGSRHHPRAPHWPGRPGDLPGGGGVEIFRPHSDRPWGPTQPPVRLVSGLFPKGKSGRDVAFNHRPSSAEVKERVELYLYSPSGPSWPVLRVNFTFIEKVSHD